MKSVAGWNGEPGLSGVDDNGGGIGSAGVAGGGAKQDLAGILIEAERIGDVFAVEGDELRNVPAANAGPAGWRAEGTVSVAQQHGRAVVLEIGGILG